MLKTLTAILSMILIAKDGGELAKTYLRFSIISAGLIVLGIAVAFVGSMGHTLAAYLHKPIGLGIWFQLSLKSAGFLLAAVGVYRMMGNRALRNVFMIFAGPVFVIAVLGNINDRNLLLGHPFEIKERLTTSKQDGDYLIYTLDPSIQDRALDWRMKMAMTPEMGVSPYPLSWASGYMNNDPREDSVPTFRQYSDKMIVETQRRSSGLKKKLSETPLADKKREVTR